MSAKKMGRPFADKPKSNKINVRLDDETLVLLNDYCTNTAVKKAEAIRQGILLLIGKSKN